MILEVQCNSLALNNVFYIIKNIVNLVIVIAPILAILSLTILFVQMAKNPEDKKLINKLITSIKALMFIFFVPAVVNVSMSMLGNDYNVSSCYNNAQKFTSDSNYIKTLQDEEKNTILVTKEDFENGQKRQLDFSCTSKVLDANFSCETIHIVEHHLDDLNYYNFDSVISSYGGFKNYTKRLGGIFRDYYGETQNVKTVVDFQRVSEYCFGYMTMYGFDYYNGRQCDGNGQNCQGKYCKWGGSCMSYNDLYTAQANGTLDQFEYPTGSSDAFFPGDFRYENNGLSDRKHFDKIIDGSTGKNMTTNCNWAVDMVYYKAGIFGTGRTKTNSSANYTGLYKTADKVIYKAKDLEVGDILAFFHGNVADGSSPGSWGEWYHAAYVGETHKDKGYVVIYDGGSRLTYNRGHKWKKKISGEDGDWVGFRVVDLK